MKILIVSTKKTKYGGKVYDEMIERALCEDFEVGTSNVYPKGDRLKYLKFPLMFWELFKMSKKGNIDFVIKDFTASLFLDKKPTKNIVTIHHIDDSYAPLTAKISYFFLNKIIFSKLKKFDAIVVVSDYWKEYFNKRGLQNVYVIHNAFNLDKFHFSADETEEFKKRFNLTEKPIIYIGNCQEGKGVIETYRSLKDLDVYLVTSGIPQITPPSINLNVEYQDYLRLLKASSLVVTMSKFKEGWCRTAHEALLCKTPVIGSGQGGMKNLLEGGGQIVCPNFDLLREKVEYLLSYPGIREKMGQTGFEFAKTFTLEKFKKDWLHLIKTLS
jgi:glycosyltransferase involved in cell wall biosynthesis